MARASFIKAARKAIYNHGKRVEYVSKKGKREGQTLSKIDRTIPADENDTILINIGESYYTWSFMNGGTFYSKDKPRQSQLTQSSFLSEYYAIQESIEDFKPEEPDEIESFVDEIKSRLEELRDQCQESLDNMPESLQYSPTGELLQERIDGLEETISEFENLDFDFEEPDSENEDFLGEIAAEEGIDQDDENWKEQIDEDMIESMKTSKRESWIEEKVEEISGIEFGL